MRARAVRIWKVAAAAAIGLAILWATPLPPVGRTGAPGDSTCAACHGGAGGNGALALSSTSGLTTYTPGASKHFTATITGSGGNAGFELSARPASNLSGGVAGNLVAGTATNVTCSIGTTCTTGNPQYIRSTAAVGTPATWAFDWTAPSGTENVTLYIAGVVGYSGNTYTATYTLTPAAGAPTLTVSPASLAFAYQVGGTAPAAQTLTVGGVASTFTAAASGGSWLAIAPTSSSVGVSINTAGLTAGNYSGSVTITAAGSTGSPKTIPVSLTVTAAAPTLTVSPASLAFAFQVGGTAPAAQTLTVGGVASTFTAAASGGSWLAIAPASSSVGVSINTAGLTAGNYSGSVTVTAAGSTGSPKTVPVSLTVTAAPTLTVSPPSLAFAYQVGGTAPAAQTLTVGGVASTFTAAASGGSWLAIAPTSSSVGVSINTAGLTAGNYSGSVTVTAPGSTGSPTTVPVSLTVTAATPTLTVSPASLAFAYQVGGAAPAAQTLTVGGVASTFTAAASGGSWLAIAPTSSSVGVSINTAGLTAGNYSGSVTITASGSTGSPKAVPVSLTVTTAAPTLTVSPASLAFTYQVGGTAPAAQTISVGGVTTTFTAAATGGSWLAVTPASSSVSVSISTAGLTAGNYSGSVTVTAAGSTGSPKTVPVSLTVTPAAPTLTVSPASLAFTYQVGGTALPAQTLTVGGVASTFTASASGGSWLAITPASSSVGVSISTAGLTAGNYSGSVTVTAPGSTGSPKTVPVSLTVTAAVPALTVSPASLAFAYQVGGTAPATQTLSVSGVASTFTASAPGGSWILVTSTSTSVGVSVSTASLTAGNYSGSVTITAAGSTGSPKTVPVSLTVTAAAPTLTVSPASLAFAYQVGGTAPPAQTLTVGGIASTFTASPSGGSWLSAASTSNAVSVSINTAGLTAGNYSGSVTITAAGSTGSPTAVPVSLTVTALAPTLTVSPTSLTFGCGSDGIAPVSQTISVGGAATTYTAAASGGSWLSVSPASGANPGMLFVSVNPAGLAAGTYNASVRITAGASANHVLTVPVTLIVAATSSCPAQSGD